VTPEEQRALDWQVNRRLQKEFKRSLQTQLKAPHTNLVTLVKNWAPVMFLQYPLVDSSEFLEEDFYSEFSYRNHSSHTLRGDCY
jgi:hypothetical protein